MKMLQALAVGIAVAFLLIPSINVSATWNGSTTDVDGDGVANEHDPCPMAKRHYHCLKAEGLWEWPAFVMSWTFSARNKMNSIKSCALFSDYKNSLSGLEQRWTLIAGGGLLGYILKRIPVSAMIMILAAGIANAAHQAKMNAQDVYARLCT